MFPRPRDLLVLACCLVSMAAAWGQPKKPNEVDVMNWFLDARVKAKSGKFSEAEKVYKQIYDEIPRLWGPESEIHAVYYNEMGLLYRNTVRYPQAEESYQAGRKLYTAEKAKKWIDQTLEPAILSNLGVLYTDMHRYGDAEKHYQLALKLRIERKDVRVAETLINLGLLHWHTGRYTESEQLLLQAIAEMNRTIEQKVPAKGTGPATSEELTLAAAFNNLGALYWSTARLDEAEPLYEKALAIRLKQGEDNLEVAESFNNLGMLCWGMGRFDEAERFFSRSLKIRELKLGADHPFVAQSLNVRAALYRDRKRYKEAEESFVRIRAIYDKFAASSTDQSLSIPLAFSLDSMAATYTKMGRLDEAENVLKQALKIWQDRLDAEHPLVAGSLDSLATLYREMGKYLEAQNLHERALAIRLKRGNIAEIADTYSKLGVLAAYRGEWESSLAHFDASRRQSRLFAARLLPSQTERDQLEFFRNRDGEELHKALSFALTHPEKPGVAEKAAAWLMNAKGAGHEARALAAFKSPDPKAEAAVRDLQSIRRELARMARQWQSTDTPERHEELAAREQKLSRDLQKTGANPVEPWVELDRIRESIPEDGVLIDFARFRSYDFRSSNVIAENRWGPDRYAAWVIPRQGPVQMVDLGEAAAIEAAVRKAGSAAGDRERLKQVGAIDAEQEARAALGELARRILDPLRKKIENAREWVISPDGELWLVPWAAMPLDANSYAIEKHAIRLVVSGRDVLPRAAGNVRLPSPSVVLADPDYDRVDCPGKIGTWKVVFSFLSGGTLRILDGDDRSTAGTGTWKIEAGALTMATSRARFTGRIQGESYTGEREMRDDNGAIRKDAWELRVPNGLLGNRLVLPGSVVVQSPERLRSTSLVAAAVDVLKKLHGKEPQVLLQANASTSAVLAMKGPRLVMLATHGFFLPDSAPADSTGKPVLNDPLLRSVLVFAGANLGSGVITAREVLSLDLVGTELVILSACDSGLGGVRLGEGVAGMRQAFLLAGARDVMATLWKIPERDSAAVTMNFLNELKNGRRHAEALRQAQISMIQQHREKFAAAHPYFWASQTLTGQELPPAK